MKIVIYLSFVFDELFLPSVSAQYIDLIQRKPNSLLKHY